MKKSFLLTIFILVATAVSSFALPISGSNGLEGLGSFSGIFDYNPVNSQITVSLTNTSPEANGGYLTAFAFKIPDSVDITGIGFSAYVPDREFFMLSSPVNAPPFGSFDTGAGLSSDSWLNGGQPENGIPVYRTGLFTFDLTGTGLESLSNADFFNQTYPWFVARFMGFNDGGGDKVPINTNAPVPEPTTMLLLGAGLIGLGFSSRKKFLK